MLSRDIPFVHCVTVPSKEFEGKESWLSVDGQPLLHLSLSHNMYMNVHIQYTYIDSTVYSKSL